MQGEIVYRFTFPNGYYYFGYTRDTEKRWATNGKIYSGSVVYDFIEKYGWENVHKDILCCMEKSDDNKTICEKIETELIELFDDKCFNVRNCNTDSVTMRKIRKWVDYEIFEKCVRELNTDVISMNQALRICNLSLGKFLFAYKKMCGNCSVLL